MTTAKQLSAGYIGLGVMGEPMCRHLATKRDQLNLKAVYAFDLHADPVQRVSEHGALPAASVAALVAASDVILFCLPGGDQVRELVYGNQGLLALIRPGQIVLDLGTTPVELTREMAASFEQHQVRFADSPVTRTRQAAQDGTLSTLVGGDSNLFNEVKNLLGAFSTDITHCGPIGAGQVVKQMNNMVLFQTVVAIGEALITARAAGISDAVLVDAMSKGSGDSFALRNHGLKAMVPGVFPERAFSTRYALKDLQYAIELAEQHGLSLRGANNTRDLFEDSITNGDADRYFPVVLKSIAGR